MTEGFIALRVSRRALAVARVTREGLAFHDGRHLPSHADRARRATERYLRKILELTDPATVVLDAPTKEGSLSTLLLQQIERALADRAIRTERIAMSEVLSSFGLPGLRTRSELQQVVAPFWPELAAMTGRVKPFVLEAAAVAEYTDVREALGHSPPL